MAGAYNLLGSETTVQTLGPQMTNKVVYATISTNPSGAIVSYPVDAGTFGDGESVALLVYLANNVEALLAEGKAVAATGSQTIDANGLLQDQVTFIVRYVPPGTTGTNLTVEADVPVGLLTAAPDAIDHFAFVEAQQIIDDAYNRLVTVASG